MNCIRNICILLLSVLAAGTAFPFPASALPHYSFRTIGNDEGLSASYVKAIVQDSRGFMWIGTKNGLDRYDGMSLRNFRCVDTDARRGNNNIGAIYEDKDGTLWVGTDRGVYLLDSRTEKFRYFDVQSNTGVGVENWIQTIAGDRHGNIWILAPNQGVFRYSGGKIDYYSVTNHNGDKEKLPVSLCVTDSGVYVGTIGRGLYFYDPQTNMFRKVGDGVEFNRVNSMRIQFLVEIPGGRLCAAGFLGDVLVIDPKNRTVADLNVSRKSNLYFYSAECVGDEIWLGCNEGIVAVNTATGHEYAINRREMGDRSLSDNTITDLYTDRDGNVWAGTMFGGVTFIQRSGLIFEKYCCDNTLRGLSSNHIRGIAAGPDGKIWIGTEGGGLNILDPVSGRIDKMRNDNENKKLVMNIMSAGGKVYVGYVKWGCDVFSGGKSVESIGTAQIPSANDVYSMFEDNDGNLWVGATWGLYRRDKGKSEFRQIEEVGYSWIFDMVQDRSGKIWIASVGDCIWRYDPHTGEYKHYKYDEQHSNGLRSNSISSVTEDSKGRLWFSSDRGGLALYNPKTDDFTAYGIEAGFPDDTVYDVLEDSSGNLWFGTNRGLVKFNPDSMAVRIFSRGNNQFSYNSALKGSDGRFYIGGIDGLIVFNPDNDPSEESISKTPLYFTEFTEIVPGDADSREESKLTSVLYSNKIELSEENGRFSVCIGSPYYMSHGNDVILYRLMPVGDDWTVVPDAGNVSFAGLSPGDYRLEVKRLGEGDDAVRVLQITVPTPWTRSWWMTIIYIAVFLSIVGLVWAYWRRRQLRDFAEKEDKFRIEKEKELYKKKLLFFTEIAHEIRTPLTLIGTPLEAIEEIGVDDPRIEKYLKVIRQNTSRLLDLSTQILDFQKMSGDAHTLKFEDVNVNELIQNIVDRFEITISNRSKVLTFVLPDRQVTANVDKDAVIKILSNLFNNAMKYSDRTIDISLHADEEVFSVTVRSDGEKIVGDNRFRIFEPFYQAANRQDNGGVGIGLPLCRTLAHLHGGTIELLDDNEPDSNTFRLTLPLNLKNSETESETSQVMAEYVMEEDSPMTIDNSGYTLLFVDDNEEMREFLYDQLSKDFVVETACDGKEALEKLRERPVDIVVTDIMMPEMDGYELCKALKEDADLSPIPVVFLTAKNDLKSKVRALECGGESYIEKPFSIKYFRQQVRSLLDNRRHERKAFLNKPFFSVDGVKMNKADEEFMNKAVELINKNIDNEDFNVESMADLFCMSRSSLLRKVKTLFNLSPVELIRIVRLKKAAELIQSGKYRMGDICFMVGINSQSYFTRLFLKQFGMTPKAFEKQCQEKSRSEKPSNSPLKQ